MKKVAIIGSGISGLTTAYLLSQKHDVTVFEKNDYIGGHTATIDVDYQGESHKIDTGFIVFNNKTYPNFLKLMAQIGVDRQETEMSFSVKSDRTGLEYNGNNLNSLFAQRRNILNPKFWSLIRQILRFNKTCKALYHNDQFESGATLGKFLAKEGFNDNFSQNYILPMAAAIWSSSLNQVLAFELRFFVQFFYNHGLLNISDRPQWYVVPGGSKSYIPPLTERFKDKIHLQIDIKTVHRHEDRVELEFADGSKKTFDDVVFACHSDQALKLLANVTQQEQDVLGDIPYVKNQVTLHTDTSMLPKRRLAWASWNYLLTDDFDKLATLTYNMNILQGLESRHTFCVTLNKPEAIAQDKVIGQFEYDHPVFSTQSREAQHKRELICGQHRTHFVGAYWYNGFHEDGVRSAVDVAKRFGCEL